MSTGVFRHRARIVARRWLPFSLAVAGAYSLTCDPGTFTVTCTDAGVTATRTLSLDAGSYTVTGTDATLEYSGGGDTNAILLGGDLLNGGLLFGRLIQ